MNNNKYSMQAILDLAFNSNMPDDYKRFLSEALDVGKISMRQYMFAFTEIRYYLKYNVPFDRITYGNIKEHLATNGLSCKDEDITAIFTGWNARPIISYSLAYSNPNNLTDNMLRSLNEEVFKLGHFDGRLFTSFRPGEWELNPTLINSGKFKLQNTEGQTASFEIVRTVERAGLVVEVSTLPKFRIEFSDGTFAEAHAPNTYCLTPYWQSLVPSHVKLVRIRKVSQ